MNSKIYISILVLAECSLALSAPNATLIHQLYPKVHARIIGGKDADISSYPYQLSLLVLSTHTCGASLISPNWALTAAHCTTRYSNPYLYAVRHGSSHHNNGGVITTVSQIIRHGNYSSLVEDYDFALLQLENPIVNSPEAPASVIRLAEDDFVLREGQILTVTGWGSTKGTLTPSRHLQVVEVPIINQDDCKKTYWSVTDRMFCAGLLEIGGKDACHGDFGGPAVVNGVLVGVASWGQSCGSPDFPGVYASVPAVREWIRTSTGV